MQIFDDEGKITFLAHVCALPTHQLIEGKEYICVYVHRETSALKVGDVITAPSDPEFNLPLLSAYFTNEEEYRNEIEKYKPAI
jgi:hypothetical protein